jgi:short-subunit dehydrogenase
MNVNFYGAVHCSYYSLPYLKQSQGRILAISSLGGKAAAPYNSVYCASKSALNSFFDALRMEAARHGISVTLVCPFWVVTEFHEAQLDQNGIPVGSSGRAIYTKKMMTADQFARIALRAAQNRRREVLINPGAVVSLLKLFAPGLLDWIAINMILKPAAHRIRTGRNGSNELGSV